MSSPIQATCPHCQAKLRVQNPNLAGKTVRCPKCSQTFVFAVDTSLPSDPLLHDPLGLPSDPLGLPSDPLGLPSDPLGAPRTPAGTARRPSGPSRRRSGGGSAVWLKPALIGIGAVVGVGLIALLIIMLFAGGSRNVVDMTYLPKDTDLLVHLDLAALAKSPALKEQLDSPLFASQRQEIEEKIGITFNDLSTLTVGIPSSATAGEPTPEKSVAVLRIKKDVDEAKFADAGLQPELHGGHNIYSDPNGQMSFFIADARTLVFGTVDSIKAAATADEEPRFEKFDFLNARQDAFVGWVPSDDSVFKQFAERAPRIPGGTGMSDEQVKTVLEVLSSNLRGIAAGTDVAGSSAKVSIQVLCDSGTASGKLKGALDGLLSEIKKTYQEHRDKAPAEFRNQVDPMLNSLRLSKSGGAVTLSVTIPQSDAFTQAMRSASGFARPRPGQPSPFGGTPAGRANGDSTAIPPGGRMPPEINVKLRQITMAMGQFHQANNSFPPTRPDRKRPAQTNLSWRVHLLPYLNQQPLYSRFNLDEPWDSPTNRSLIQQMPAVYKRTDSRAPAGKTTFLTVDMPRSPFEGGVGSSYREITDGTSNTAMIVIVDDSQAVEWTRPQGYVPPAVNLAGGLYTAPGTQTAIVGMCDGTALLIRKNDDELLRNVFQEKDGNVVQLR
jgi:predicted Zn finger-like uncharacterized protein